MKILRLAVIVLVLLQEGCPYWVGLRVRDSGEPAKPDESSAPAHNPCGGTVVPCVSNPNAACCPGCGGPCL
jgi:hypothetical protein